MVPRVHPVLVGWIWVRLLPSLVFLLLRKQATSSVGDIITACRHDLCG